MRRRVLDYSLTALLLLLPLFVLRANLRESSELNSFDKAILRVSAPLQTAVSWIVEGVGGLWDDYVYLVDVEDENDELRSENDKLRARLAAALRSSADLKMLERLVELRDKQDADTVGARVIASSVNPFFRTVRLRLDRGQDEVSPGMPVVNSDGLVGRVFHAFGGYSDVLLLTDPKSSVEVYLPRTGSRGVLKGLGRDNSYACEIGRLSRDNQVQEGDLVVTSGLGSFPAGVPVGRIVALSGSEAELFQRVEVEPLVKFSDLKAVLVILAPPPPPDPSGGKRKTSEPARGATVF